MLSGVAHITINVERNISGIFHNVIEIICQVRTSNRYQDMSIHYIMYYSSSSIVGTFHIMVVHLYVIWTRYFQIIHIMQGLKYLFCSWFRLARNQNEWAEIETSGSSKHKHFFNRKKKEAGLK